MILESILQTFKKLSLNGKCMKIIYYNENNKNTTAIISKNKPRF